MKNGSKNASAKSFFCARRRYGRLTVYTVLFLTLAFALAAQKNVYSIFVFAIVVGLVAFEIYHIKKSEQEFVGYVESLDYCLSNNTRGSLLNYPAPLVITDVTGKISWYNDNFKNVIGEQELFDRPVSEFVPEIQISKFVESENNERINLCIGDNHYEVWGNVARPENGKE